MIKKKCIFFDFDGVLAESVNIKTEAFRKMYINHGKEFSDKVVNYHLENGGISRFEKFKVFNGDWLGEEITEKKIQDLAKVFSDLVVEGVVNSKEVKGADLFLNSSKDYIKYIITGTPTIEIKPILERRKMNSFFKEAFGSPEKKSFWVKEIMDKEGLNSEQCVFIGDALADYKAAVDNDITFILRETFEGEKMFKDFEGYRIKDLTNLHSVLSDIFQ